MGQGNVLSKSYVYTAQDNMETMADAVNYNHYQQQFILRVIDSVKSKEKAILDFGAGIGTYADMIRSAKQPVDCVDLDPHHLKVLREKGYVAYQEIGDVKKKYDVIFSLNVLEHIKDDRAALAALRNAVSDNGKILLFVPAFPIAWTSIDNIAEHYRRYRIADMQRLAHETGLHIESIQYCDPVGFFGALFYRLIRGKGTLSSRSVYIFDRFLFPISRALEPLFQRVLGKNILVTFTKSYV
jgi:SAM-dependent methyltransferase